MVRRKGRGPEHQGHGGATTPALNLISRFLLNDLPLLSASFYTFPFSRIYSTRRLSHNLKKTYKTYVKTNSKLCWRTRRLELVFSPSLRIRIVLSHLFIPRKIKEAAQFHRGEGQSWSSTCVCHPPFCALYGSYSSQKELIEINEVTKCGLGKVFLYPKITPLCVLTVTKYRGPLFSLWNCVSYLW